MTEQEYQDKLKVRQQLSLADRLRVLEYEFDKLIGDLMDKGIIGETIDNGKRIPDYDH